MSAGLTGISDIGSGAFRQAMTWANVDLTLCRHMVAQGHNELKAKRNTMVPLTYVV